MVCVKLPRLLSRESIFEDVLLRILETESKRCRGAHAQRNGIKLNKYTIFFHYLSLRFLLFCRFPSADSASKHLAEVQ